METEELHARAKKGQNITRSYKVKKTVAKEFDELCEKHHLEKSIYVSWGLERAIEVIKEKYERKS